MVAHRPFLLSWTRPVQTFCSEQCPGPVSPLLYPSRIPASEVNCALIGLLPLRAAICAGVYVPNNAVAESNAVCTFVGTEAPLSMFNSAAM